MPDARRRSGFLALAHPPITLAALLRSARRLSVHPHPPPALEVVIGQADDAQPPLPLASDGVLRWLWRGRFGEMLIEVVGDEVFVNGQRVSRHEQHGA